MKEAIIRPELAPDQSRYNAADPDLREAAALLQKVNVLPAAYVVETERSVKDSYSQHLTYGCIFSTEATAFFAARRL